MIYFLIWKYSSLIAVRQIAEVVGRLSSLEQFVGSLSKRLAVWVAEDDRVLAKKGNGVNGGKPSRRRDWLSNELFDRYVLLRRESGMGYWYISISVVFVWQKCRRDCRNMASLWSNYWRIINRTQIWRWWQTSTASLRSYLQMVWQLRKDCKNWLFLRTTD